MMKSRICYNISLIQIIEQAYRPHSSVEWHFACSMRSKGRHRAGVSAPQPPRTPLALLDELHEGQRGDGTRLKRRGRHKRDDTEDDTKDKRGGRHKRETLGATHKKNEERRLWQRPIGNTRTKIPHYHILNKINLQKLS